ncbi:F-box/FBD/LRR-repeat protein At1g13570-like [Lycium barbarum]|uniref:F-box/FBD/LRR-repeat protein At1g13570-like n=1 Tax=Lycium barbarum TaxID=112863 RepID=UPI00293E80B4|nr:F-box/FBD/LRR-repeat protein At1g13570-like [Lycium barbarum]
MRVLSNKATKLMLCLNYGPNILRSQVQILAEAKTWDVLFYLCEQNYPVPILAGDSRFFLEIYCFSMSTRGEKCDCQTAPLDILCSLPENVIDDILMRLPLRDAMQTSILSKKWRYNWCRLPELTLDLTNLISTKYSIPPMFKFTNIFYHLLTLHTGPITKFDLSFSSNLMPCPTIDNLIYFLSRNGIQHLVLKLSSRGGPYKLPTSLFTCFQLRRLTLQYCSIIPPPTFKGFDQLTILELRRATITSKFLESLISHCGLLEQLVLDISDLSGVVEINAPWLRCFKFAGEISSIYLKYIPLVTELSLADMECYEGPRICDIAKYFESFPALEHLRLNHGILMVNLLSTLTF